MYWSTPLRNVSVRSLHVSVICTILLFSVVAIFSSPPQVHAAGETVNVWLTTGDLSTHLAPQANLTFGNGGGGGNVITVNENQTYQQMDGFGASFTDSSAWLVYNKMSGSQRSTLMNSLFSSTSGIGLDFLRQPIGASDLTPPAPTVGEYSYDDMPAGQTDPSLTHFSINHDTAYIIPVLKQALQINPSIKIMGTPWSPPGWMKSSGSMEGGTLNSSAYSAYANYFAKYVQAYQAQGLPIYAITPQNEPLYVPNGYPGMSFPAADETNFIKNNLGPTFAQDGITTKILGYDHNWDQPGYPDTILGDSTASSYTAGTAWHCYGGTVDAQTTVHNSFPNKDTWETECSGGTWENSNGFPNTMSLLIGVVRNWGKSVVRWGMVLDPNGQPNLGTGAACSTCRGVVSVDQNSGNVTYNGDYYGLGQASKFVAPGAYHIDSSAGNNGIQDVAFKNPDGSKVLVAYNSASSSQSFNVQWGGENFAYTLPAGAAATFKWSGTQAGGGSGAPIGKTIWLNATNGNYVSARIDQSNNPLNASATQVQAWEEFDVIDAGNGLIALKSHANGDYVSTRIDQSNNPLDASATQVQAWEEFTWLPQSDGTIALQAQANGDYVSARTDQNNTPLEAMVTQIQGWEKFTWGQV
ncbi:glycoside hydrolase family 30 beta sandwich domain-containing protein [Dictyobacter kobayashii]|uniref:Glucosylceramidase n=1 Tax=Dictyobacter kobayashii TaxID=2014872 RepID=A0A402AYF0_9CHLR|nr:glycoside hydrolase family 30 beta sandwich domain-containing protein [Dictyobacter kobayashii]GCE24139.1 glucosylceramidase [Dictyobacter kobayashii]